MYVANLNFERKNIPELHFQELRIFFKNNFETLSIYNIMLFYIKYRNLLLMFYS